MRKLVLLTFDYELFLGKKSGGVRECLTEPTNRLLSILNKAKVVGVFFIDTMYLKRLQEKKSLYAAIARDYDTICMQLTNMVKAGHYIFPHIHGHWIDAEYEPGINEWILPDLRHYCFAALPKEEQEKAFSWSIELLENIIKHAGGTQQINSYRAGGWSIQPFKVFRPFFRKYGIRYDWSVIPGKQLKSNAHSFDFRNIGLDRTIYQFDKDISIEDGQGEFTELTISSLMFTKLEKWLDFKFNGIQQRVKGKPVHGGTTVELQIESEEDVVEGSNKARIIASFEGLTRFRVSKYFRQISKSQYFQFISHPKLLTDQDFVLMEKLLSKLTRNFTIRSDFFKQ